MSKIEEGRAVPEEDPADEASRTPDVPYALVSPASGSSPVPEQASAAAFDGRKLTVALFTDNYGPGHSGLLYAVQMIEGELLRDGHKCVVVAPACDGPNPHADKPGRSEIRLPAIKLPGVPAAVAGGRRFEKTLEHFEANPPDIIHVHGLGSVGMLGVWAADRTGVPLMVTWHTDFEAYADHYAHLTPFLSAYFRLLELSTNGMNRQELKDIGRDLRAVGRRLLFQRPALTRTGLLGAASDMLNAADLVTAPSDKTAIRVRELAPNAHIRVSPNGADALPPGPPLGEPSGPRIIYVGRIAPEKGIPLLLEAFEWVREEVPDAELMIVGEWRTSPILKQKLARARRRGGVTLVGQVPRDSLAPYYDSADIFAFPSLTDTQALVLHEAAHEGLPIVSVDHELRLVLDEGINGMIARPTPESLARNLIAMLKKLEDPDFRAAARARSKEMASWWTIENQTEEIVRFYGDLAAGRPIEESMKAVPPTSPAPAA